MILPTGFPTFWPDPISIWKTKGDSETKVFFMDPSKNAFIVFAWSFPACYTQSQLPWFFLGGEYMFWIKRSWYPVSNLDVGILISWDKKRDSIYYIIYVLCVEKGRSRWAPTIQFRKRKYHTTAGPFPLESIFQHLKEYTRKAQHSKGYLGFLVAFAFDPILCWIKDLFEPKFVQ